MSNIVLRDNHGIDYNDKEVRKAFPAIFNHRRSTRVSEDYQMYDSLKVIEIMAEAGLTLVEIGQERHGWSKVRQPHTGIHTMRFRSPDVKLKDFGVGDSFPEVVCMNSHDGRTLFRALAGVFRLVCSNGMIVADQQYGAVSRRHYGEANAFGKVQDIIADMPRVINTISHRIADWSAITLDQGAQLALARELMADRNSPEWLLPEQVLEGRRDLERVNSDGQRDMWKTFNVLQESLTNSEVKRLTGEGRARSIRPIHGVVGNVGINQKIWGTAEAFFAAHVEGLKPEERAEFDALRAKRAKAMGVKELVSA